jgi:hypothetical protein
VSIDDRDWYQKAMRDREPWPHPLSGDRRRSGRPLSPTAWAAILVITAVGSSLGHDWWQRNHPPAPAGGEQRVRIEQPVPGPFQTEPPAATPSPAYREPTIVTRQVTKCVVNGTVTYSAGSDCPTGARTVAVDPTRSEIEGGFTQYQLDMLRSADARIERQQAEAEFQVRTQAAAISTKRADCAALDKQIQFLDDRARRPISGYEQEVIRAERSSLRSTQFALHC